MSVDRFGKTICIGWPEHHIIWLEAALSLPRDQHTEAFQDIADMTGRSLAAVRTKAYALLQARIDAQIAERTQAWKAQHEAMCARRNARRKELAPSKLKPLSKAKLMGAR